MHEGNSEAMNFNSKNFKYTAQEFGHFMKNVQQGRNVYMRALSKENPADKPAMFSDDFPEITDDFEIASEADAVRKKLFSSVLRISGKANMWLHFDVSKLLFTLLHLCICTFLILKKLTYYSRLWPIFTVKYVELNV